MDITTHASVDEFFHEVVVEALEARRVETTESTEHYLVGLLGDFTTTRIPDEPLSIKLATAEHPAERVKALKQVGDTSLYVAGFFSESLGRKWVDPVYYMGLGEAAYRELSCRLSASAGCREVYEELAARFPCFVDVLADIRAKVSFVGNDVVALYEQWLKTRADWIEQRLRRLGLVVPTSGELH